MNASISSARPLPPGLAARMVASGLIGPTIRPTCRLAGPLAERWSVSDDDNRHLWIDQMQPPTAATAAVTIGGPLPPAVPAADPARDPIRWPGPVWSNQHTTAYRTPWPAQLLADAAVSADPRSLTQLPRLCRDLGTFLSRLHAAPRSTTSERCTWVQVLARSDDSHALSAQLLWSELIQQLTSPADHQTVVHGHLVTGQILVPAPGQPVGPTRALLLGSRACATGTPEVDLGSLLGDLLELAAFTPNGPVLLEAARALLCAYDAGRAPAARPARELVSVAAALKVVDHERRLRLAGAVDLGRLLDDVARSILDPSTALGSVLAPTGRP